MRSIRIRPGYVTIALVTVFTFLCLGTVGYAFLHVPAPAGGTVTTVSSISGTAMSRSFEQMDLESMKSSVMSYDVHQAAVKAHQQAVAAARAAALATQQPPPVTPPAAQQYPTGAGAYSYTGLENLWETEGGSASVAPVAACIAEHESSGEPWADNGTDQGLWQIDPGNFPGDNLKDASVNAADAVKLSRDGTDWSDWQTAPDCGV